MLRFFTCERGVVLGKFFLCCMVMLNSFSRWRERVYVYFPSNNYFFSNLIVGKDTSPHHPFPGCDEEHHREIRGEGIHHSITVLGRVVVGERIHRSNLILVGGRGGQHITISLNLA